MSGSEPKKPTASDYYAWSTRKSESQRELERLGVDIAPKKLEPAEAATPAAPALAGASAWNGAGTWEERDRSSWASDHLKTLLKQFRPALDVGGLPCELRIADVPSCSGTASVVFVRQKLRAGFEFTDVRATWELCLRRTPAPAPPAAAPSGGGSGGGAAVSAFAGEDSDPDSDDEVGADGIGGGSGSGAAAVAAAAAAAAAAAPASGGGSGGGGVFDTDDAVDSEPLARGSLHLPELSDDCGGSYEVKVKPDGGADVGMDIAAVQREVHQLISKWVEDVKHS